MKINKIPHNDIKHYDNHRNYNQHNQYNDTQQFYAA